MCWNFVKLLTLLLHKGLYSHLHNCANNKHRHDDKAGFKGHSFYVNDIQEIWHLGSDLYLYADDSKLFRNISGENDSFALQSDLNSLRDWFKKWLLRLNINKCNVVSFGRNVINAHQYSVDDIYLEHIQHIKDLGITFDVKLNFSLHICEKVNKANSILGIIKRNFRYWSQESFVMLYKALIRSHLENANVVCSPYKKCDICTQRNSKEGNKIN